MTADGTGSWQPGAPHYVYSELLLEKKFQSRSEKCFHVNDITLFNWLEILSKRFYSSFRCLWVIEYTSPKILHVGQQDWTDCHFACRQWSRRNWIISWHSSTTQHIGETFCWWYRVNGHPSNPSISGTRNERMCWPGLLTITTKILDY